MQASAHSLYPERAALERRFIRIRARSEALAANLLPEDQVPQSMEEASPTKWHLAHTTWFFETFLLQPLAPGYRPYDEAYAYLFNSYYQAVGPQYPRSRRGLATRPSVAEIAGYRRHVGEAMLRLIESCGREDWARAAPLVELGINHEEQHQELILTDILHLFSLNPVAPAVFPRPERPPRQAAPTGWTDHDGGVVAIGHADAGFAYDNEGPRHEVLLRPFRLASRLVTNAEYRIFMEDGGYCRPELWLSDGWSRRERDGWSAPLYWRPGEGGWRQMTLAGPQPLEDDDPLCHVSYYEADAYARWAAKRLPTEAEWEAMADGIPIVGNLLEALQYRPLPPEPGLDGGPAQMFGDAWEWTASPYMPYPGFRPAAGAVGEYNGKFMCNQMVLRGGSCVTPAGHIRRSYRNFFYPDARWQFSGIRLVEDA